MREIESPDGRVWRIERVHTRKEPHEDDLFVPSVVVTVFLLGFLFVMIFVVGSTWALIVGIVVFALWGVERLAHFGRPSIQASTEGPPPATYVWKTRHRYGYDRIEAQIADEISRGDVGSEPEGATLVSSG